MKIREIMGRVTGFEPATPSTTNWCSNQLSYTRHKLYKFSNLYPAEGQEDLRYFI